MKKLLFLLSILVLTISCSSQNNIADRSKDNTPIHAQKNDDGEYDLDVLDSQFTYFINAIAKPMNMYSESYLKSKNQFLVSEWNSYYFSGRYRNIIESSIDYDPNINYGIKFEYKLYQVFAFVKWKYGLKLNGLSAID
ncbi:hypothetical protein Q73A0000_11485 [Kaistella flava (ex Peng et al. 2021)]|uniref:Lipoprotein n=1 Tax=Kaistella flava (ex Peng et al. 2021) TaxID=2038776 RepID=A0A7M2YBC0_9FLAO|nr:DUF6146 family protein [Kaistella flava (ex Peng et al. 2021)]QOW10935.1 hypothetical protein Q73A0000_11485 [Kaistella flava (ex Peng et al. 2021)]